MYVYIYIYTHTHIGADGEHGDHGVQLALLFSVIGLLIAVSCFVVCCIVALCCVVV